MKKLFYSFLLLGLQMAAGSVWAEEIVDDPDDPTIVSFEFPEGSHWKSYCSAYNLQFNDLYESNIDTPDEGDCYAFVALSRGKDEDGNIVINLHHMQYVPKKTGIWLWGNRGANETIASAEIISDDDYNDKCTDDDIRCIADNKLVGTLSANELTMQDGDYFLFSTDDYVHSATATGAATYGITMPANTALLRLGKENAHAPLRLSREDTEEELSIDAVCTEEGELIIYDPNQPSYDLQGRLIDGYVSGVHIQHGYRFYLK